MRFFILAISLLCSLVLFGSHLDASLYLAQFKSPTQGPYVECYLNVSGRSVAYRKDSSGTFGAQLEVLYLFKQANKIVAYEKYQLQSPVIKDSTEIVPNFTDVQRILLPNGIYNFEVRVKDVNDSTNNFSYQSIVSVDFSQQNQFSDIELVESYSPTQEPNNLTKGNVDLLPFVSSFFPNEIKQLNFYTELYNENRGEDLLLHYYIASEKTKTPIAQFSVYKRIKSDSIQPFFLGFDLSNLPTGNYYLVLNLKNRENKLLSEKKMFFQRLNTSFVAPADTVRINRFVLPYLATVNDKNKMRECIKCAYPLYNQKEILNAENVLKTNDLEKMKSFFNRFWASFSSNPKRDWAEYKDNVAMVNRSYSSQIKKGYETDRGRVYLKYGVPNDINRSVHEPSSYPYEIWQYFELKGETNVRFVFYNPDISGDDYQLLHSDLQGEINNAYWQRDLTRRNSTSPINFDDTKGESQYGNRGGQLYKR